MSAHIEQAAACLRCGNHGGAAAALRELEHGEAAQTLQTAVRCLSDEGGARDDVYVRFVALKVLTFALTRCRSDRRRQSASAVAFLMSHGYQTGASVETHALTPVVSELATAATVALKLGCVGDDLEVVEAEVVAVCAGLVDLAQTCTTSSDAFLHRAVCQAAVEEFGLFRGASRYRGLPVRVHRRCRELFAAEGRLPGLIQALLRGLLRPAGASAASVDKGLVALVSCFAWPSHQFFEEDSSTEESCGVFHVAHAAWDRLLVGDVVVEGDARVTVHGVLREWYGSGAVGGIPVDRQKVIEVVPLLCSFKGGEWTEEQSLHFVAASLSLCLDVFEHLSEWAGEEQLHLLPLLANAIVRLVSNYVELFFHPHSQALVSRLAALTNFLVRRDTPSNADADVLSCLDELLSVWFHLTSHMDRSCFSAPHRGAASAQHQLISEECKSIFATYLSTKVSASAVELEEDYFADTFTNSHLHLVAQIGRVCAGHTCELLVGAVGSLRGALAGALATGGAVASPLFEALWTLLKIIGFFIADPADGEQPYIPRCFLDMGSQGSPLLLRLVEEVMTLLPLLQQPAAASPAVHAAFLDILAHYIKTYVEAEESCAVYRDAFGGGAGVVTQSLCAVTAALRAAPFEAEATSAACRVLDCVADKSSHVRAFCATLAPFQQLEQAARDIRQFHFCGHTRGRLIAFVLVCFPDAQRVQAHLHEFPLAASPSDDVNVVLEVLSSLAGVFESLHSQQVIRCIFPALLAAGQQLLHVAASKFYEREIAVEAARCVRSMFVACSPLLEDSGVRALLDLVVAELRYAVAALQMSSTWSGADGESDKAEFIVTVAKLLSAVAQWKALDCFLLEEDIRTVSETTVEAAGALLRHMDERSLSLPGLEDALFSCVELCAESFTPDVVFASCSDAFFSAMLYALNSERVNIQRAGISVTSCVAAFLEAATPQANHASACGELLTVVLRALASGKVFLNNLRPISRALLILARGMPHDRLVATLEAVAGEVAHCGAFVATIFPALHSAAAHASVGESAFEELLQDALSSLRGTAIIGA